jgi:protein-S-isoprenylcysteine O-methyltransferase Ste14
VHFIPQDPVGLPGLAAVAIGFVSFLITLLLAGARGKRAPQSADSGRRNGSIGWMLVQGIGIAIAGFGPVRVQLDPLSPIAITEAVAVLVLMLGSVWLFDASSRTMGRNWALVARTRDDGQLVQSGPFAWVRNPIYVALGGLMLGIAIAYGHALNLLLAAPLYALGTWMRVRHEEKVLYATFGAAFEHSAARVKRFVPGLL